MNGLISAFRLLAASQVLLFACVLAAAGSSIKPRASGVALAVCVIAYLLIPLAAPYLGPAMGVAGLLANAIPPVLFWFAWQVFEDRPRLPRAFVIAALVYLGIVLAFWPSGSPGGPPAVVGVVVQSFKLGFALAAIVLIWRGRHTDLVESRLRRSFVAAIALMVVAVVMTELVMEWNVPMLLELIGMAGIFGLVLAMNLAFLRPGSLLRKADEFPIDSASQSEDPVVAALFRTIREDRLYADHDLRIATLAARLVIPEYRLRRTINRQLGYRNFNQFVNSFRIGEAAQRLKTDRHLPILSIALDVGIRSVSSFNTAFRERFGVTPSQYRARDSMKTCNN